MSEQPGVRGSAWFKALTGQSSPMQGDPGSVLTADAKLGDEQARFLCVVPNPQARFPCVRRGEVGLEEAYTLARRLREVIERSIDVAIVDILILAFDSVGRYTVLAHQSGGNVILSGQGV